MDAAEYDVVGFRVGSGVLRELEGVPLVVGVLDHLFPLVVVAQDGHLLAQPPPHLLDTPVQFVGFHVKVLGGYLLPANVYPKLLRQRLGL